MKVILTFVGVAIALGVAYFIVSQRNVAPNDEPVWAKPPTVSGDSDNKPRPSWKSQFWKDNTGPKVGETATLFTLSSFDGASETKLESLISNKPAVLIFGSYT